MRIHCDVCALPRPRPSVHWTRTVIAMGSPSRGYSCGQSLLGGGVVHLLLRWWRGGNGSVGAMRIAVLGLGGVCTITAARPAAGTMYAPSTLTVDQ